LRSAAEGLTGTPAAVSARAALGDALRAAGRADEARAAYAEAAKDPSASVNARYAKARVTELEGEAAQAGGELPGAAGKYLDAADLLLALGSEDPAYLKDAQALYEKVAKGTGEKKDWRGEPTARAVFSMGEVERVRGHFPEAIAYYQRTFVSWVKYPAWPARAYLRAAECMDKLGKREFAIRHLRELVRKVDRYGALPEYQQAKAQLRAWGEAVQ
jgi:tetratricopeptide (TPR) repeat protein